MKSIKFTIRALFSKRFMIPLSLFSIALLFLTVNTSCNKEDPDIKNKDVLTAADAKMALMAVDSTHGRKHVNVRSMGAAADGTTDDTKAFQKAIDAVAAKGGGTVWVPPGDYSVNADSSIYLKSNVTLSMADRARLIARASTHERYYVIKASGIHDARILGGQIIGDRDYHIGTIGEHGYGIAIQGCNNVQVSNTNISNCWGDGLIVGGVQGKPSVNTILKGVICTNNRRQGMSIFDVNGLIIDSCQLSYTNGTKPQDGIDIEPDVTSTPRIAQNITITNCEIFSNLGNGIEINVRGSNIVRNVTVRYNKIYANKYSGYIQKAQNVTFTDNWLYGNKYDGNRVHKVNCVNSVFEPNTYKAP